MSVSPNLSKEQIELAQQQRVALLYALYDLSDRNVHKPISLKEAAAKIGIDDYNHALAVASYLHQKGVFDLSGGGWGGRMTVDGIDLVEKSRTPSPAQDRHTNTAPSVIHFEDKSIRVSSSGDAIVQAGHHNTQTVRQDFHSHIEQIKKAIDGADANEVSKSEAKSLLSEFLKHPLVTSIAGGIAGALATKPN
jgi:N-methylhydantoinase B/oxoprolinase/acetone carboxylase alpha subunit